VGDLDRARIADLHARELDRFRADRPGTLAMIDRARAHMPNGLPMAWMASDNEQPVYVDHGAGSSFTDLDGFSYVDFNASDMAMFCGHANPDIVAAIGAQAARSTMFLLPTEASVAVAEELSRQILVGKGINITQSFPYTQRATFSHCAAPGRIKFAAWSRLHNV